MAIRKRAEVSSPRTLNYDQALRIALRAGIQECNREIDWNSGASTTIEEDMAVRRAHERKSWMEEMLRHDGVLQLVKLDKPR